MFLKTYNPKCRVNVYDKTTRELKVELGNISNDIVSISTNKAFCRPQATWVMMLPYRTLSNGLRYDQSISPMDIVTIEFDTGSGFKPVMLGLVDRTASTRQSPGSPRQVKISGSDFGKLLLKQDIGWDVNGTKLQETEQSKEETAKYWSAYQRRATLQTGTPADLLAQLTVMAWETLTHGDMIDLKTTAADADEWHLWDTSLHLLKGTSIWAAMERVSHQPINVLNCDTSRTDPRQYVVTLEPQPIKDNGRIARDTFHEISDEDVATEDIGASDADMVNLLCYWPTIYNVTPKMVVDIVLSNPDLTKFDKTKTIKDIELYGYRAKIVNDPFTPPAIRTKNDDVPVEEWIPSAYDMANKMWGWWRDNHTYESGTYSIHLSPHIRAGDALKVTRKHNNVTTQHEFMIEQVSHMLSFNPNISATTQLQVTRGQKI